MAEHQRNTSRENARPSQWTPSVPGLHLLAAVVILTLLTGVSFAAPQVPGPAAPPQPPAPPSASPAPSPAQPDKPATPANAPPSAAMLIARAKVGDAQMAAREYDDAIATFLGLVPLVPDRGKGDLWAHIGEAYRMKGDYPNSIQAFEKAYALAPNDSRVASNLGVLYEAENDKVHAREFYEKAIAINPNNPLVLNNLAFLLTEIDGDLDLALTYARTAQAKLPTAPEIDDTIGWIDLKKNMIPGAIAEFHKITLAQPNNPIYHYHYAMALKQQGNSSESAKECQAALSHKPDKDLEAKIKRDCGSASDKK